MLDKGRYGPWAIVAGASEGIGLAFVEEVARAGINVMMVARRKEPLELAAEAVGAKFGIAVRVLAADLSGADIAAQMGEAAADLDVGLFVFNAASANFKPFLDQTEAELMAAINLSCVSQTRLVQHFGRRMVGRRGGGLLLVSSFAGSAGIAHMACYSGAKAFTDKLGEALWAELKPLGIDVRVQVVGSTDTPRRRASGAKDVPGMPVAQPAEVARHALANIANGPIGALPQYDAVWNRVYDTDRVAAVTNERSAVPDSDLIF